MHAQVCPKCNGQGIVSKPPWIAGDISYWVSSETSYLCNLCNGTMIIYVPDSPEKLSGVLVMMGDAINTGGELG